MCMLLKEERKPRTAIRSIPSPDQRPWLGRACPDTPPIRAGWGESALSAAKGSRSELGRQVAVDLETDADLHKDRSGPGHCWFPKVCLSGMILLRDAHRRKPARYSPDARPLVECAARYHLARRPA